MNKRGLTLLEALISFAIIQIGLIAALYLNEKMVYNNKGSREGLNYAMFRNQVLMYMSSNLVWKYTLEGALNSSMACWINQDQVDPSLRNCNGQTGNLVIYDIKGVEKYNFTETNAGLSPQGLKCTDFVAPPAQGNPACPMKFSLTWTPVCEAGDTECVNPQVRIDGTFQFNGSPEQQVLSDRRLNFSSQHFIKYCPPRGAAGSLGDAGVAPAVTVVGTSQVISGNTGKIMSTGYARMSERIAPCRNVDIAFKENVVAAPIAPAALADPENRSRVCLFDEATNQCRFEILREINAGIRTFRLRYGETTDVFQMPSFITLNDNSIMWIQIRRNRVDFAVDGRVIYTWFEKITYPFQLQFMPASRSYSPQGFYNIQVDVRD